MVVLYRMRRGDGWGYRKAWPFWPAPDSLLWWRWRRRLTDASVGSKTPAVNVHRCPTGLIGPDHIYVGVAVTCGSGKSRVVCFSHALG
jgi:hypothetical protein